MTSKIRVPAFPESVTEGNIAVWHKKQGDQVKRDEPLVDIETDKVMLEVPAPADGVLQRILAAEGDVVTSEQEIAVIEVSTTMPEAQPEVRPVAPTPVGNGGRPPITPSAQRLIREAGLDAAQLSGTGRGGRILKEDVLRVLQATQDRQSPATDQVATEAPVAPAVAEVQPGLDARQEKRVPMTRLRARIAERLVEAQHTAAILTTFNEVDMQAVIDLRQHYREPFEKKFGVRLGFMSFFVKASIEALKAFPLVNASVDGNDIVYHGFFDIGVAIGSPRGLVVPILRDADAMSLAEIEQQIVDYAEKAGQGRLSIEEMTGGSFTITNGGVFGSLLSTPILNPPQSAILGMHKIEQRAVVVQGEIVIRPMMYLALSYDHRIIDGREAVQFLVAIKDFLEDPARLLIGV